MKALITGVSGRVGANLAVQLKKKGYEVRGLVYPGDPKTEKVQQLDIEIIEAEVSDADKVYQAVDGVDVIAHLAAQMKQGNSTPQRMFEINALGTLNVLEGAVRSSKKPESILLASTDQTYHPFVAQKTTFYEEHVQQPRDIYALTKIMSEQMFFEFQHEYHLPVRVVRYSSVLAADEALQVLAPGWLDAFINKEWAVGSRVPWFGPNNVEAAQEAVRAAMETPNAVCGITDPDGVSWGLPFTDVRDTVRGTILVLESSSALGGIFNLVGPTSTDLVPAAHLIAAKTDRPYLEVKMPFLWHFSVANNKARSNLGYQPLYDFSDMVESALAFQKGEDIGVVPV